MKSSRLDNIHASLVIPIFNNEETVLFQLKKCEKIMVKNCKKFEIIVCDDKSTDLSASILKKNFSNNPNFQLIFHNKNQGIARTVKSLYKKAKFSYVVLFSADGDWNPIDIERLLTFAKKNKADMVIGKRTYKSYPIYRKVISFFYNFLPYIFFQTKTIDAGSIKVIRKEIIHSTPIISGSVFFEAEIIIRATKRGKKIVGLPIYFRRNKNKINSGGNIKLVLSSFFDLINLRLKI